MIARSSFDHSPDRLNLRGGIDHRTTPSRRPPTLANALVNHSMTQRQTTSRAQRRIALAASVLCAVASLGAAQKKDTVDPDRFTVDEAIDVRLIHLDAVVTDRSGERLADLSTADFDLRVDGKKVKVTGVSDARTVRDSIGARLTAVVVMDERNLMYAHRDRVLDIIKPVLVREMNESPTWVAMVAVSDTVEPLLAPTRNVGAVQTAIDAAKQRLTSTSELIPLQRAISAATQSTLKKLSQRGSAYRYGQAELRGLAIQSRGYAEALAHDARRTLRSLEEVVAALSFLPGRKALLFITDGLAREPLDILASTMNDRLAGASSTFEGGDTIDDPNVIPINTTNARSTGTEMGDGRGETVLQLDDGGSGQFQRLVSQFSNFKEFERLAALANTHRVTFYPIKAPITDSSLTGLGTNKGQRGSIAELTDMNSGLAALAHATGGLAFSADSGLGKFVDTARADVSNYYSLSFTPPGSLEGTAIREIELKVRERRSRVRHRASYVPLSMEENLASRAWGTLLFDWQENQHGLEIDTSFEQAAVESQAAGEQPDRRKMTVVVSMPIGGLELVRNGDVVAGNFRSVVQLRNAAGVRLSPRNLAFVVEVPRRDHAAAKDHYFALRAEFFLGEGAYDMAVGLWEENTGKTSFVAKKVEVGLEPEKVAWDPRGVGSRRGPKSESNALSSS